MLDLLKCSVKKEHVTRRPTNVNAFHVGQELTVPNTVNDVQNFNHKTRNRETLVAVSVLIK